MHIAYYKTIYMAQTKKTLSKSAPVAPETAPVVVEPVAPTTPETPETPETVEKPVNNDVVVSERFDSLTQKVVDITNALKDLQAQLKTVQKELVKMVKSSSKRTKKVKDASGVKKTPSGFAKPTKLSDELCDFLGVTKGTELARTDVTRRLNNYIKSNSLQDEKDKRRIHPDVKLAKILGMKTGEGDLTYFNLQSKMKHHFVKAVAA